MNVGKEDSVLIFATNNLKYVQFAFNCAESILLHNDIQIYIVTNLDFPIPFSLQRNVSTVKIEKEHAEMGIGMKLYIDKYLQTERSLFIDSDCLCFGDLQPVFTTCENKNFSVVGTIVNAEEWVGTEQATIIEREFAIKQLPRFNGGMYYIKKGRKTSEIFDFARSIIPDYDHFGFQRINNKWINEEGPLAIAMVKHMETPMPDDGRYMTDLYTDTHPRKLNVLKGIRVLNNPPKGSPRHRPWYPEGQYSPTIIHFGGSNLNSYIYRSQVALLQLYKKHIPQNLATQIVNIFIHIPFRSLRWIIGSLRNLKTS